MNATTTIPTAHQLTRSRLVGLMAAVIAVAAAITWALIAFAVDGGTVEDRTSRGHAEAIAVVSPRQLAAAYGNGRGDVLSTLDSQAREYVEGIMALTPAQLAAAYGR
jgi:hypothetical protein